LSYEKRHLLFLNYFSLLGEEPDLLSVVVFLQLVDEERASLVSAPDTLHETTRVSDRLEVPLDTEHAPVGLNGNGCLSLLFSLFFSFTLNPRTQTINKD